MQAGDIKMIYEDPLTEQKPEGEALLLSRERVDRNFEFWNVQMLSDGYCVFRKIKKEAA